MFRALRNQRYLWVDHKTTGEYELYDLREDPYELRNLEDLDFYAPIRRTLEARLNKLQACRGATACSSSRPKLALGARQVKPPPTRPKRKRSKLGEPRRDGARASATCVRRDLRLAMLGVDASRIQYVVYYRGARRLRASAEAPLFPVQVKRRALPRGRQLTLRALVTTIDGRRATYDRRVRTCPG
jgi:hypothetical protein